MSTIVPPPQTASTMSASTPISYYSSLQPSFLIAARSIKPLNPVDAILDVDKSLAFHFTQFHTSFVIMYLVVYTCLSIDPCLCRAFATDLPLCSGCVCYSFIGRQVVLCGLVFNHCCWSMNRAFEPVERAIC
jgi:hypothetical protein